MSNNLVKEMIIAASILVGDRILVVDSSSRFFDMMSDSQYSLNVVGCDPSDFRTITRYPAEYMNGFDIIICPDALHTVVTDDRILILQCLVWSMKKDSRLIFSLPNMKSFKNKKRENKWKVNINEDGQFIKYTMSESSQYYRVIKKIGFMNKVKEYWHKSAVCYPSQIFKTWNSLNENSKWDLENIAIKKQDHSLIFSINMKKNILE